MNSFDEFSANLKLVASQRSFAVKSLGKIGDDEIYLVTKEKINQAAPYLLIAAGFPGPEIAGPLGIIDFLRTAPDELLNKVNLSFLPLVCPSGFELNTYYNAWQENTNSGFAHPEIDPSVPSREGQLLLDNLVNLKMLSKDGFLSLHEESDAKDTFYLYTFEDSAKPGPVSKALLETGTKVFRQAPDCVLEDGEKVVNGIVLNNHDGSFEDRLWHEGVPFTACTETPGKSRPAARIKTNADLITTLATIIQETPHPRL